LQSWWRKRGRGQRSRYIYLCYLRVRLIFVGGIQFFRDAIHSKDVQLRGVPAWFSKRHFIDGLLVYLIAVDDQAARCAELLPAHVAFEMLRFLVLDENLLIIEHTIAVVTPGFHNLLLLLLPHGVLFTPALTRRR